MDHHYPWTTSIPRPAASPNLQHFQTCSIPRSAAFLDLQHPRTTSTPSPAGGRLPAGGSAHLSAPPAPLRSSFCTSGAPSHPAGGGNLCRAAGKGPVRARGMAQQVLVLLAVDWGCSWRRGGVSDPPTCAPRCQMLSIGWSTSWPRRSTTLRWPGASRSGRSWRAPSARTWTRSSPPRSTWPARSEVQPCRGAAPGCGAVPTAAGVAVPGVQHSSWHPWGVRVLAGGVPGGWGRGGQSRPKGGRNGFSTDQGHSAGIPGVVVKGGASSWRGLGTGAAPSAWDEFRV